MQSKSRIIFIKGLLGGIGTLTLFYYLLLFAVTQDPMHPLTQFQLLQPWMSLLIIGFGIQMGLFWMMHQGIYFSLDEQQDARFAAGTGSAVSGAAMVACCAHHLVDVLPILGLSAAALFFTQYQQQLLIFGVITNIFGIGFMLWLMVGKVSPKTISSYLLQKVRSAI